MNQTKIFGFDDKSDKNNFVEMLFEKLSPNSTSRDIVELPQIGDSTVNDWLQFFIKNAFIFIVWILAMAWVVYLMFYNSRVLAYLLTKIVNNLSFLKLGYFKIGSISFSAISCKLMFRDLVFVTEDYSLRVRDGWIVFCYWVPYIYRDIQTEDLSNSDARVLVFLNGFELHIYNRSKHYSVLEKLFGLPSKIFGDYDDKHKNDKMREKEKETREKLLKTMNESATVNELKQSAWRDLFPVTRIEISSGRFVFGNHLIPSTLSISFEECNFHYTSQPAVSRCDLFTHIVKGKAENLQVVLVPSPKHSDYLNDEPPRFMGDGFIVFRTNKIDFYYYQDEPGLVLSDSDNDDNNTMPAWGMVVKCGKGTDFSYGPWADRQRAYLYSFFYPSEYQIMPISEKPKVGELRRIQSFDLRLSTLHDAKIDILFSKNKETHALHINASPGSYLELTIPWVYSENGFTTHILGQILHLDATTSLQFRPLISSETFEFDVKINYPRIWNAHQNWDCKITACKATVNLIFAHKIFIQDLIDDWSDKNRPDILKFIPYTWKISLVIKEFELLILANEHNWIDCSTALNDENCKIAICGEHFDMAFDLPFIEFLPPKLAIKIWIQGECLQGAFYLPECSLNRDIIELLQRYSKMMCCDGNIKDYSENFGQSRKWKNIVSNENHWYECMTAPIVALSITYDFYPMPVLCNQLKESEITTPELEEMLLSPLRPESTSALRKTKVISDSANFDPITLPPDVMTVELEIGPMNLALFGVLFRFLWNIKENYLGESQLFSEMSANFFDNKFEQKKRSETTTSDKKDKNNLVSEVDCSSKAVFDPRLYRPFEVIVSVTLHEIQGHLIESVSEKDVYSPLIFVEKLCFELHKTFLETRLQLLISPSVLQVHDGLINNESFNSSYKDGFLTLSSLQFRGHAMFSNLDRPIESETLEYAWLVEVEVGEIFGRITLNHLSQIVVPLETFFFQILQADIELQPPNPFKKCLHDLLQNECSYSDISVNRLCPYSEDIKYRLVRVILNPIELFLLESNVTLNLIVPSVKLATCNLHVHNSIDGFTLLVENVVMRQFVNISSMNKLSKEKSSQNNWMEISSIISGPIFIDSAISSSSVDSYSISQIEFIKKHDFSTKRLWFIWNDSPKNRCGCVGNCLFFGCNFEGQTLFDVPSSCSSSLKPKILKKCLGDSLHNHSNVFNPEYGESLLHPSNFLLDIESPLILETNKIISQKSSDGKIQKTKSQSVQKLSKYDSKVDGNLMEKSGEYDESSSFKPSSSFSERFFSAEDISATLCLSKHGKNSFQNEKTLSNIERLNHTSLSSSYASPTELLSTDTLMSHYYTARDENPLSRQMNSANTSNATLQKFQSLSSDSSTLVSVDNENKNGLNEDFKSHSENETYSQRTMSSTSFISAVSEDNEELGLVDLRNQLEKPIIDSPLLMTAYSSYLSIYRSKYFDTPPPYPLLQSQKLSDYFGVSSQLINIKNLIYEYRHKWKPQFELKKIGFSEAKLIYKSNADLNAMNGDQSIHRSSFVPGIIGLKNSIQRAKDVDFFTDNELKFSHKKQTVTFAEPNLIKTVLSKDDNEISRNRSETINESANLVRDFEDVICKIQIFVQFQEMDVKISPLTLDLMSSFLNSLIQIFTKLHPVTLLNHLSLTCQNDIEQKNLLKKEKLLYLGQLHLKAWKILKQKQSMKHLNRSISFSDRASKIVHDSNNTLVFNNLDVDKKVSLSVNVDVSKINVNLLQASVVEEIISFSALDNVKDLTCVSVINFAIENISFNLIRKYRVRKVLHVLMDQSSVNNLSFTEKALMTRFFTKKPKKVYSEIETNAYENITAFIEEVQINASFKSIQLQLSRLVNSPEVLKNSTLTVIPFSKTKVDFWFTGPSISDIENVNSKRFKFRNFDKEISSSSSSTSSKKNVLRRQECVVDFDQTNLESSVSQNKITSSASSNLKSSDFDTKLFNRFIMFECGIQCLSFSMLNSSSFNVVKLNVDSQNNDSHTKSILCTETHQEMKKDHDNESVTKPGKSSEIKGTIVNVWFHFASPPKLSNVNFYNNDFTRHDWHLLSSTVPLAIAWISAIDRMAHTYNQFENLSRQRITSTIVALLSSTLNDYLQQKNSQIVKPLLSSSKQLSRIISALSKTFQDDLSICLINVLRASFNRSFNSIDDFEAYFLTPSIIPNHKELEKAIIILLLQWKDIIIHTPSSYQSLLFRNQANTTHSGKLNLSSTKNQLIALLEEKINLARNNIVHDSGLKSSSATDSFRLRTTTVSDNDSFTLNITSEHENETSKLLLMKKQQNERRMENMIRDDTDLQAEICSNTTKNTGSDLETVRQQRRKIVQNRVNLISLSQARILYDRLISFPVVRNISTICHSSCSGIKSSWNKLKNSRNQTSEEVEMKSLNTNLEDSSFQSLNEVNITLDIPRYENKSIKNTSDDFEAKLEPLNETQDATIANGRYSSYSNYGDKKDLYWWMVKQQDYMKNVASTFRDYTKPTTSNIQYFNLGQDTTLNATPEMKGETLISIDKPGSDLEINEEEYRKDVSLSNLKKNFIEDPISSNKQSLDNEVFQSFYALVNSLDIKQFLDIEKRSSKADFGILGSKLSLLINVNQFCIDVDETEQDIDKNICLSNKNYLFSTFCGSAPDNLSAFDCENLTLNAIILKKLSIHSNDFVAAQLKEFESHSLNLMPNVATNLTQLLQEYEKKCSNGAENALNLDPLLIIGFGANVDQVIQRINLPLIRLIHQFSALYDNVSQTRFEMRTNRTAFTQNDMENTLIQEESEIISLNSLSTTTSSSSSTLSSMKDLDPNRKETVVINVESPSEQKVPTSPNEALKNKFEKDKLPEHIDKCWGSVYLLLDKYQQNKIFILNSVLMQAKLDNVDKSNEFLNAFNEYAFNANMKDIGFPIIISGNGLIKRMNLVAMLSGLKLNGDLTNFGFGVTHFEYFKKNKAKQDASFTSTFSYKDMLNTTVDVTLEKTKISLYEESLFCSIKEPSSSSGHVHQQLVVEMMIGKSNVSFLQKIERDQEIKLSIDQYNNCSVSFSLFQDSGDGNSKKSKYNNSARLLIGAIEINIPQHPVALHGMMTRSGRQLSTTLQELRSSRQPSRLSRQHTMTQSNTGNLTDSQVPSSPLAHNSSISSSTHLSTDHANMQSSMPITPKIIINESRDSITKNFSGTHVKSGGIGNSTIYYPHHYLKANNNQKDQSQDPFFPFIIDFNVVLESFTIKASLLPSLRARYEIKHITSSGFTGSKAKFIIDINQHSLFFNTLIEACVMSDPNLPTEASINLPRIHISAEYMEESAKKTTPNVTNTPGRSESFNEGIVFCKGSYLNMNADIGSFEHCLTTDLLNHLLFVQKVFMKEINEVVQKMSRTDANEFFMFQNSKNDSINDGFYEKLKQMENRRVNSRVILFSLHLRMTGIQITATTPTNNAVRLETGAIKLHISNRVLSMPMKDVNFKLFVCVQLDFNLALGLLIKNFIFEEAEPDFQQLAYFKTRINMRNVLQDEIHSSQFEKSQDDGEEKEVVFITLTRPLVFVQPLALDKAVLVWINYKNAYEYWNEQRSNLNTEVIQATQQVIDKVQPLTQSFSSSQPLGTLFLQLNVNDFGICLPISNTIVSALGNQARVFDADQKDALVLTLESTRISACSSGSLVSKAQFNNLCIRFADDFEIMLDDWKPNLSDSSVKNLCIVSEGTYEICSRTISHTNHFHQTDKSLTNNRASNTTTEERIADAKWILSVSWKMDGFDIHVDTSIGKHITALFKTMTSIAGDENDEDDEDDDDEEEEEESYTKEEDDVGEDDEDIANVDYFKVKHEVTKRNGDNESISDFKSSDPNTIIDLEKSLSDVDGDTFKESLYASNQKVFPTISTGLNKRSSIFKDKDANKKRTSRNIEKELNEQAKVINDLRQLGASDQTIQQEMHRFQELEAEVFNNFRRGVIKKLKRPSNKSSSGKNALKMCDFNKTRAFSTSLYSCDASSKWSEDGFTNTDISHIKENEKDDEELKNNVSNKIDKVRSSTISIAQLANKNEETSSLETLSSGDDSSSIAGHVPVPSCSNNVQNKSQSNEVATEKGSNFESNQNATMNMGSTTSAMNVGTGIEPHIDFELDVKIFFNSGKCVLHTKDQVKNEDFTNSSRNFSATEMSNNAHSVSPTLSVNNSSNLMVPKTSLNKSRSSTKLSKFYAYGNRREYSVGMNPDFTVFLIPGLDIKLHYSSKSTVSQEDDKDKEQAHFRNPSGCGGTIDKKSNKENTSNSNSLNRQKLSKKAFLFAWITLSSIPEEIFISPHILDFFEEALKPLPITVSANSPLTQEQRKMAGSTTSTNNNTDTPAQYVYYASFPVDVIVFFHFQPTIIRLGCLPVSRVECLLHLPSIDLVMSSKRSDFDFDMNMDTLSTPQSFQNLSTKAYKSFTKSFSSDSQSNTVCSTGGGLSITGCLADFSLYIFHPYGGQKNKSSVVTGSKQMSHASYSNADRKDSLSLQVEFIKINISRSRKVILGDSLTQSISFSAICDIGTATFKYDVRRLNEILSFPKAWYRKSIWKKIFIGENTLNAIFSDEEDEEDIERLNETTDDSLDSSSSTSLSNEFSLTESSDINVTSNTKKVAKSATISNKRKSKSHTIAIVNNPWETLVLLTVNFSKLNISMNMGNIMGNANWLTRELMCDGSISIDSSGNRKLRFGICLKNSTLDAKGGIVGGIVELSDIRTELNIREDQNREPQHRISCSLHTIENRVDYMGTSILMTRVSDLGASFYDEWRVMTNLPEIIKTETQYSSLPTKRPASIYVHGCLKWDQMQILMSNSTTPDFAKIISKLDEFFTQQFNSGKRVFDSLHPTNKTSTSNLCGVSSRDSIRSKTKRAHSIASSNSSNNTNQNDVNLTEVPNSSVDIDHHLCHYRHWQKPLQFIIDIYKQSHGGSISDGIILGGTIEVRAQNISLACFHGVNFRTKSWAVFSLRQPSITYMTEAQHVQSEDSSNSGLSTHVVQNLSLLLGRHGSGANDSNSTDNSSRTMATVSRISRTVVFPPQFRQLHEWFHYAFSPMIIDDVNRFPLPSPENAEFDAFGVPIESLTSTPSQLRHNDRKIKSASEFNNKEERIFAFPSMQLELKTEHLQGPNIPSSTDSKPSVHCSFISDFDDHIYVAVDAEAYYFLHNLIMSYINESNSTEPFSSTIENNGIDKFKTANEKIKPEAETSANRNDKLALTSNRIQQTVSNDYREFICKVWHLEPTVRLHSWASKNIDPYGVDYILQRLGFNQARTTIPKWIQRSTMDGIDKLISVLVYHMIVKNHEENSNSHKVKEISEQ